MYLIIIGNNIIRFHFMICFVTSKVVAKATIFSAKTKSFHPIENNKII